MNCRDCKFLITERVSVYTSHQLSSRMDLDYCVVCAQARWQQSRESIEMATRIEHRAFKRATGLDLKAP